MQLPCTHKFKANHCNSEISSGATIISTQQAYIPQPTRYLGILYESLETVQSWFSLWDKQHKKHETQPWQHRRLHPQWQCKHPQASHCLTYAMGCWPLHDLIFGFLEVGQAKIEPSKTSNPIRYTELAVEPTKSEIVLHYLKKDGQRK